MIGGSGSVFSQRWPGVDESALELETITMVVQVNGKLRGSMIVPADISEAKFFDLIAADDRLAKHLEGRQVIKKIYVPGKLMNIVVQ
jgi:leucyl-tRNA synthetase